MRARESPRRSAPLLRESHRRQSGPNALLSPFLGARAFENVFKPAIPFVTRVLEDLLAIVTRERHRVCPRPGPRIWIGDGDLPLEPGLAYRSESFRERVLLAVVAEVVAHVRAIGEVGRLDD